MCESSTLEEGEFNMIECEYSKGITLFQLLRVRTNFRGISVIKYKVNKSLLFWKNPYIQEYFILLENDTFSPLKGINIF